MTNIEKQSKQVNGIKLAYEDHGSGETLLLIHGLCGSSRYWDRIIPVLSEHYRVIAVDLRGHGDSDVSDETYTMELLADDIAQLMETLAIHTAILFGHSLGGYVTLAFAERHADKLRGFSLVNSSGYPDDEEGRAKRLLSIKGIRKNGMDSFMEGLVTKLFTPAHLVSMKHEVDRTLQIGLRTNPMGAINALTGIMERPVRNHIITESTVPVLLIASEADQVIPLDKSLAMQGDHITHVQIPNSGHMSLQEYPSTLANEMLAFANHIYKGTPVFSS